MDKDIDDFEKRVLGKSGDDSDSEKQDEPKIIKKDSQKKSMIGSQLNFDKRPSKLGSTFVN